jgi:hypothetical protein
LDRFGQLLGHRLRNRRRQRLDLRPLSQGRGHRAPKAFFGGVHRRPESDRPRW